MVTCSEDIPQNKERAGGDGEYKQEAILQTTRLAMFSPCSPSLLEGHARPTTRPHHQCCCLPAPPRRFTFISPESESRQAPLTHTSRQWTVQINGRPVGTDRQPPWRALSSRGVGHSVGQARGPRGPRRNLKMSRGGLRRRTNDATMGRRNCGRYGDWDFFRLIFRPRLDFTTALAVIIHRDGRRRSLSWVN